MFRLEVDFVVCSPKVTTRRRTRRTPHQNLSEESVLEVRNLEHRLTKKDNGTNVTVTFVHVTFVQVSNLNLTKPYCALTKHNFFLQI